MKSFRLLLASSAALLALGGLHAQTTLASWTFETSVPTTGGPLSPEVGLGSAVSNTSGAFSNPAGNGSTESWSSNNWDVGEYFQFTVNGAGYDTFNISWDQTGSNTGPKDFSLSYSLDGTNFTAVASYSLVNAAWSTTLESVVTTDDFSFGFTTSSTVVGNIIFRLTDGSTVAINNGVVAATGTGRVDNVTITASAAAIPEPSTYAAIFGALALGLVAYRRRRLAA